MDVRTTYSSESCIRFSLVQVVLASSIFTNTALTYISLKMEKPEDHSEKTLNLVLQLRDTQLKMEIPLKLPFQETRIPEMAQLIITSFDLPILVEKEVEAKLRKFVEKENFDYLVSATSIDERTNLKENLLEWENAFKEETLQYNPPEVVGDDEVFAEAYHALVHSPMLGTVLRKESALNSAIREVHRLKNQEVESMNEKQSMEMTNAISSLNSNNSSTDVNTLASIHFDESHLVRTRWESLIESENAKQKREYRNWIVRTYEDYYIEAEEQVLNKEKGLKKKHSVRFDETLMISYGDEDTGRDSLAEESLWQESFTIHLGSQMKQMYNIRLLCCHPFDFLRFKNESSREISPQRLQMAISLYSTDLSGIVVLTDPEMSIYKGVAKDLADLTQQTTEFHFDTLETQLKDRPEELKTGDFVVSRHSNLNGAHVVFHLVANQQSLNRTDINSRHPAILGLRNILKTACLNDVTTITIPALLAHEMTEAMTINWCNRRAELVYKCVKGFMIEMASWGGSEMKNLQFIAPKDISDDLFTSLASMLPNIFRVSNPLRLSSSSSSHSLQHQLSH